MSQILNNVIKIYEKHGSKIKSDKHLLLVYWRDVDGIEINKSTIDTEKFISHATSPVKIIQAMNAYQILKEEGE